MRIEVTFGRRGRRRLPPPALVLRDPFGLAQRVIPGPPTDEILVLPRIFPVNLTAGGGDATPAHARASLLAAAETEIDGLRPWREGSPASRIHWQTFARSGVLMERKLISEADSRPLVVIDPRAPDLAGRARRRRARGRLAGRPLRAQDRLLAADARRPPRVGDRARPARVARAARPARAARRPHRPVAGRRAEPPRARDLRRRPPGRPRAARARPHAGRLPRRRARARWATAARCSRSRGATATCPAARAAPPRSRRWRARRERRRSRRHRRETARAADLARRCRDRAARRARRCCRSCSRALLAFTALAAWGALHWMSMLEPAEPGRGWMIVLVGLLAVARDARRRAARGPPADARRRRRARPAGRR